MASRSTERAAIAAMKTFRRKDFTKSQLRAIGAFASQQIRLHHARSLQTAVRNDFKPWLAAIRTAYRRHSPQALADFVSHRNIQQAGLPSGLVPMSHTVLHRLQEVLEFFRPNCTSNVALVPRNGFNLLLPPRESTTATIKLDRFGGPGAFKSSASLAIGKPVALSLGVGVGRGVGEKYPATFQHVFGDGASVNAFAGHYIDTFPPSSFGRTRAIVTARCQIGYSSQPSTNAPTYTSACNGGSIEDGPVMVQGTAYVWLLSSDAIGPISRTVSERFLLLIANQRLGRLAYEYRPWFDVTAEIPLKAGASTLSIIVWVELDVLLTGRVDQLSSGFAAIDLRDQLASSASIFPFHPGGGPIWVREVSYHFCQDPFTEARQLT